MSYKELHVSVMEDEVDGHPIFKVDGVGYGISEFVHALRNELPSAVNKWRWLTDPYSLMKYSLDWIVSLDTLNLFDWKIVYTNQDGGFLQLSYCRPSFVERESKEVKEMYATRFERILQCDIIV